MALKFKKILDIKCGLRYLYSDLRLASTLSRSIIIDSKLESSKDKIEQMYKELTEFTELLSPSGKLNALTNKLSILLSHLRDIRNSLKRISEGAIADDIELFEIKSLSMLNEKVKELLSPLSIQSVTLPDLSGLCNLLDPEGAGINSFYIYDSYSDELKGLRNQLKMGSDYENELHYRSNIIENQIREHLSKEIKMKFGQLEESLSNLAKIDILVAKAEQALRLGLSIPVVSKEKISYKALFNPEVEELLTKEGKSYQKTDIEFTSHKPLLITGSNMGGKSLTLKTLALCQFLFQSGFAIPAQECEIAPVKEIMLSTGDEEDYRKGLSSFSAEIKRIDSIIKRVRDGEKLLVLIDEPARTTNPYEGAALASSLLEILFLSKGFSVMTSHYTISDNKCDRLRVKGFYNGKMDYTLVIDSGTKTPAEALIIAESLDADKEWIELARMTMNKNTKQ
ncbi:MAG: DNA mismatch repair protein MutS [Rikenellaceae bacterium]|nr:DNA mismatch repair protein MutS [Rikenellaceae bacterium]